MLKEYIKRRRKFIKNFKPIIKANKNRLPSIVKKYDKKTYQYNSWFNINVIETNKVVNNCNYKTLLKNKFSEQVISCMQIDMDLNLQQKNITQKWMDAYTEMYNKTLHYVRTNCPQLKTTVIRDNLKNIDIEKFCNMYYLRSELKTIREDIMAKSNSDPKFRIHTHTLDYAISQFVSNLKSAITNTYRGNFKRFRIKFWKFIRPSKTIEIEKCYIRNNMVCPKVFGNINYIYNNKLLGVDEFPVLDSNVKINYNMITINTN